MADRASTNVPTNIQNSLDEKASSSAFGNPFKLMKNITNPNPKKKSKYKSNCPYMPKSVKACTDDSPSTPLLVKKVEYKIKINVKMVIANVVGAAFPRVF